MSSISNLNRSSSSIVESGSSGSSQGNLLNWTVTVKEDGTINPLPESVCDQLQAAGIVGDLIYSMTNVQTNEQYFGSVKATDKGNTVFTRFENYKSVLNSTKKTHFRKIEGAMREHPTDFCLSIVEHCPGISEKELLFKEDRYVTKYDTISNGYNARQPLDEGLRTGKTRRKTPRNKPKFSSLHGVTKKA